MYIDICNFHNIGKFEKENILPDLFCQSILFFLYQQEPILLHHNNYFHRLICLT
jgi:hypothetical protein